MQRDSVRRWKCRHHIRHLALLVMAALMQLVLAGCGGSESSSAAPAPAPNFVVCSSTYALCTTALCSSIEGDAQNVSCNCDVTTGYSAGLVACPGVVDTPEGDTVVSRYFPITSYLRCANDRPWAMCLDSPCIIDPNDPTCQRRTKTASLGRSKSTSAGGVVLAGGVRGGFSPSPARECGPPVGPGYSIRAEGRRAPSRPIATNAATTAVSRCLADSATSRPRRPSRTRRSRLGTSHRRLLYLRSEDFSGDEDGARRRHEPDTA
jgi:hypothetical protein